MADPTPTGRIPVGAVLLIAVTVVGVLVSLLVTLELYRQADQRAALRFEEAAADAADAIVQEVGTGISIAEASRALLATQDDVERSEFAAFVDQLELSERFPAATGLARYVVVAVGEEDAFLEEAARLGQTNLEIHPDEAVGDERWVLLFNEPEVVNRASIGLDIRTVPPALTAASEAARLGQPRMTEPITLVQETERQAGLVVYVPVFDSDAAGVGPLIGFTAIVFRGGQLLDGVLTGRAPLRVGIADADSSGGLDGSGTIAVYAPPDVDPARTGRRTELARQVAGRDWTITVEGLGGYETPLLAPAIALLASLLLTGTLAALVRSLQLRGVRAQHLTDLATADLRRSEAQLEAANAELAAANADLNRTNAGLARSNAELARYAYVASHDLKEPVRMVSGFAGLLRAHLEQRGGAAALSDMEAEALMQIERGAQRMQSLITDLLELASIDQDASLRERIDVAEEMQHILELFGPDIAATDATVRLGALDPVVMDPRQVRGLLQNLVSNALKFQRPGTAPVVQVEAVASPGSWTLRVTDNGIGIPVHDRDTVFEAFKRMHPRDDYDGTGVGLAICQQVTLAHGGRIRIEDGFRGGTAMVVELPQGDRPSAPG